MKSAVIQCFIDDFERFWAFMETQIKVCPEELWHKKAGGYVFSQQVLHSVACAEIYALANPNNVPQVMSKYDPEVLFFSKDMEEKVSKEVVLACSRDVKKKVDAFLAGLTLENLTASHERMTKRLGKPQTLQNAAMALIRHCNYHLGSCDACLRENGVNGVY